MTKLKKLSYGRLLIIVVIILLLFLFSYFYQKKFSCDIVFEYQSPGSFKNIFVDNYDNSIYVEKTFPSFYKLNLNDDKLNPELIKGEGDMFVRVYNKSLPAAYYLSKLNMDVKRIVLRYTDTFNEFYGYYEHPLWQTDDFKRDESYFYSVTSNRPLYMKANDYLQKAVDYSDGNYTKEECKEEYGLIYEFDFSRFDIEFTKKDYILFSLMKEDGEVLYSTPISTDIPPEKRENNVYLGVNDSNVYVYVNYQNKIYVYKSNDRGKTFSDEPDIYKGGEGKLFFSSYKNSFCAAYINENQITLLRSDNSVEKPPFKNTYKTNYKIKDFAYDFYNNKGVLLKSGDGRDYLTNVSFEDNIKYEKTFGNIMFESFDSPEVLNGRLIFQKQYDDSNFKVCIFNNLR
ncbi:MAG: hypothetical protein ACQESP_06385 [Candidatus Muiribacteriota bacterium]